MIENKKTYRCDRCKKEFNKKEIDNLFINPFKNKEDNEKFGIEFFYSKNDFKLCNNCKISILKEIRNILIEMRILERHSNSLEIANE